MKALCVCGEQLKFIADSSIAYAGCGELRCIKCGRNSGYCTNHVEAEMEFERIYNCKVRRPKSEKLMAVLEFEVPKNCLHCLLLGNGVFSYHNAEHIFIPGVTCKVMEKPFINDINKFDFMTERHPDCPLKIITVRD